MAPARLTLAHINSEGETKIMNKLLSTPLTPEEEITLRRVAFGESPAITLRAQDLARLRYLGLIDQAREPGLTTSGRVCFKALPKAAAISNIGVRDLDEEIERLNRAREGELRSPTGAPARGRRPSR